MLQFLGAFIKVGITSASMVYFNYGLQENWNTRVFIRAATLQNFLFTDSPAQSLSAAVMFFNAFTSLRSLTFSEVISLNESQSLDE